MAIMVKERDGDDDDDNNYKVFVKSPKKIYTSVEKLKDMKIITKKKSKMRSWLGSLPTKKPISMG